MLLNKSLGEDIPPIACFVYIQWVGACGKITPPGFCTGDMSQQWCKGDVEKCSP